MEKNIDDADTNAFRYCGEYYDSESDTIYLRARYYDPTIGRFISRDSYAGKNEDPLNLNLYTYCHNNPILGVDPSGHLPNWAKVAIGAVATVAAVGITVATGGAAAPVLISVASSVAISAGTEAVSHRLSTGSWEGAGEAALDGAVDGFMWGGIFAAAGSTFNAVKSVEALKNQQLMDEAIFARDNLIKSTPGGTKKKGSLSNVGGKKNGLISVCF